MQILKQIEIQKSANFQNNLKYKFIRLQTTQLYKYKVKYHQRRRSHRHINCLNTAETAKDWLLIDRLLTDHTPVMTTRAPTVLQTKSEFEMHMKIALVISGFTRRKVKLGQSNAWCQYWCAIDIFKTKNIPSYQRQPCSVHRGGVEKASICLKATAQGDLRVQAILSVHIKIIEPCCKLFVVL